jgi:uncharacterized lipoprotein YddW (UPF0748 family)
VTFCTTSPGCWILFGLMALLIPACTGLAAPTSSPTGEVRGVWLTTTANDAIASGENTADTMRRLRKIGINTVYVETWKNGYTQFPSKVLMDTIGVDRRPALVPADPGDTPDRHAQMGRDLLEETLIQAHRNGLIYIAWFEYGFMAAHRDTDNHLRRMYPQWMTTTRDGNLVSDQNPFVWMNPLRPKCRDFLLAIVLEAVDKYDLDGVQLDDRIAWPVSMGYDDYTREVYAREHNGAAPPDDPHDKAWVAWRAAKVTEFAETFYAELKIARPNLIVSISPAVYPWSLEHYACDWPKWSRKGWMQEYVPQNYRYDFDAFEKTWRQQVAAMPGMLDQLVAGVMINGGGKVNPWADIERELDLVRASLSAGHVFWFSPGVLDEYPDELTAYYKRSGTAANPRVPTNWRPMPIVCAEVSPGVFTATISRPGRYRVIVERNSVWTVVESRDIDKGEVKLEIAGADTVELLVDRRSHEPLQP